MSNAEEPAVPETIVKKERSRVARGAFELFAFVGFLSSIVTIWSWFTTSSAALSTAITQTSIELPKSLDLKREAGPTLSLDQSVDDLLQKYCNPVSVDYDGSKSKNVFYDQKTCDQQTKFMGAIKQIANLQGAPLVAYDITITDVGSRAADNIKIKSPIDVEASAVSADGHPVQISVIEPGRVFGIPSLNPRESTSIRLVSTTPVPSPYDDTETKPTVTFSGGKASSKEPVYLSSNYAEVAKFLDGLSLFFQIAVILLGSCVITLIWMLPLALLSDASDKKKAAEAAQN